jgi:hypothetical protein
VIVNLTISALKSCSAEGSVEIWARVGNDPSEVTIGVTGTGSVVVDDFEELGHEPDQADAGYPSGSPEFGLGLSMAKELVRLNLGRIDVTDESDQGTTISFGVPFWDARALATRCLDCFARSQPPVRQAALIVASVDFPRHESFAVVIDEFLQSFFRGDELAVQVEPCKWLVITQTEESQVGRLLEDVQAAWARSARTPSLDKWPTIELQSRGVWPLDTERWILLENYGTELALGSDNTIDWMTSTR